MRLAVAALAAVLSFAGCGYRVAGRADLMPKHIRTIAVPAFANLSNRTRLSDRLPAALSREFISRGRYRIVADPREADAVLNGVVVSYTSFPTTIDAATNRASGVQVYVVLGITLQDRNGTVLFSRNPVQFQERYEIAVDQRAYLDESDVALDRMGRDVARTVVSAVLENF